MKRLPAFVSSIVVAACLLAAISADAKKKTEDDFDKLFTVTAVSTGDSKADRYCPMTVSTESTVYVIYSRTWQCLTYPVGTQVRGRFTKGIYLTVLPPVHAEAVELMYFSTKGKLKTLLFVVDSATIK